jgi:heptosyltransferase-3
MSEASRCRRVLVFRTGHLGDTVCAIPAFRRLRRYWPNARLTLVCDSPPQGLVSATSVVAGLGIFDAIQAYRSRSGWRSAWGVAKLVLRQQPDCVVMLPQSQESPEAVAEKCRFFRRLGTPLVLAHQGLGGTCSWQLNEAERLLAGLDHLGLAGVKETYGVVPSFAVLHAVRQKLAQAGLRLDQPWLAFCGGGKSLTQQWPCARYARVLSELYRALGVPVLGVGSPEEVARYKREILPVFPHLVLLPDPLTMPELFGLFHLASAYVGNDTGPMHVAAAMGCPVIAVMSARNAPGAWDPDVTPRLVLRHRTFCEGCFRQTCTAEGHRCMESISVDDVLAQMLPFLRSLPRLAGSAPD